jgi:dihydroorotate dehydrogenase (NAD+) catalytic subunit
MANLKVNLCGVELDNPIIPSSGTFGYGEEFSKFYDINVLGSFSMKGTTRDPRFGNETPRIAECASGMLNSIGLQNPGVHSVIERELPRLKEHFRKPLIANVCGFSIEEYVYCSELFDNEPQIGILEVNISCPNVKGGGISLGSSEDSAYKVTRAVKEATTKPVFVKLTPNVTSVAAIARACVDAGADGISLINLLTGMRFDLKARRPILANRTGGLSGPAVLPIALRMVADVRKAVDVPIMGMGGISRTDDVIEMLMAGASAVQIGSENLRNPYICPEIIAELPQRMEELGFSSIDEIVGVGIR